MRWNQSDLDKDVDKYLYVDELESNVGELDRKLVEGRLMQSSTTDLITT